MGNSVVAEEVARFNALAARWWDPRGPMAPLHAMNPLRVDWVDRQVRTAFDRPARRPVRLLDIGCGGGLVAEALARLGHDVLGIDAASEVIAAARAHAAQTADERARAEEPPLRLEYRAMTAEQLLEDGARFDVVAALEVVEHVADPASFVRLAAALLVPGGVLVMSTLNRTRRSYLFAKLGAEYVLRLLPVGTHAWRQFLTPAELAGHMRGAGLRVSDVAGMSFSPMSGRWVQSRDTGVNYIMAARLD